MGQGEPAGPHVERHPRHERRHDHDRRALALPRLEPAPGEVGVARRAADGFSERGQAAARGGRLNARVEPPAERVGAVREADGGLVDRDHRHVFLQAAG
ncbi:MAG: hypothetical protein ACK559_10050, partial [bacterium]